METNEPKVFFVAVHRANWEKYKTKFSYSAYTDDRDNGPEFRNVRVIEYDHAKKTNDIVKAALRIAYENMDAATDVDWAIVRAALCEPDL